MFKLFSVIGQGIIWLATHPKVRKMIWGWAVDGYKFVKGKLKKDEQIQQNESKKTRYVRKETKGSN